MSSRLSAGQVPASAVLLILISFAFFSVTEATAKFLTASYPVLFLVWARYTIQAGALAIWFGPQLGMRLVRTPQFKLQILRGVVLILSSICLYTALRGLPLADATAIVYCTPVFVVLLAVVLIGERMTRPRWAFVIAGFLGMMLVVRPGASILQNAALFALAAAVLYAVFQILTRQLSGEDSRVTLFYPTMCGAVVMGPLVPSLLESVSISWTHVAVIGAMGGLGTAAHFLFIRAHQLAPASALTPYSYTQLIWSAMLGWLAFGQFPDQVSLIGMFIIGGSGLLLAWHERRRAAVLPQMPMAVD